MKQDPYAAILRVAQVMQEIDQLKTRIPEDDTEETND